MKAEFRKKSFPRSRIATFDTFSVGLKRHHVAALPEFDVTDTIFLKPKNKQTEDYITGRFG
jgi:ABC-type phosphate transport system ATPase subunit